MRRPSFEVLNELPDDHRRLETYLARLPAGANPMTHNVEQARERLSRMSPFPMLSMPDDGIPNQPLMENGQLIGVDIHEALHRFFLAPGSAPRPALDYGIEEQQVAVARVSWRLAPDGYVARPGSIPPPTPLRPDISQRFVMEGRFFFGDAQQSGFHGFSVGRTFPGHGGDGTPSLRFAAMVEILEGYGIFFGHIGNVGINGVIEPPKIMRLAVMPIILDFDGHLTTRQPIPSIPDLKDPGPDETFFAFRGELPEDRIFSITPMRNNLLQTHVDLPLRNLGTLFHTDPQLIAHKSAGPKVGMYRANFWIGPIHRDELVPFQSVGGHYDLIGPGGRPLGSLDADVLEGRSWYFQLPGLDAPSYRFAGIGPVHRGTGIFEGVQGFVTMVGVLSVFPRTMVIYYIIRLADPTGRIREATYGTHSAGGDPEKVRKGLEE